MDSVVRRLRVPHLKLSRDYDESMLMSRMQSRRREASREAQCNRHEFKSPCIACGNSPPLSEIPHNDTAFAYNDPEI